MKYASPVSLMTVSLVSLALFAFSFAGCSSSPTESTDSSTPAAEGDHGDHEHGDHEHGNHEHGEGGATAMEKMTAELAKLSPEDAASAMKQHFCPVTGEMLGTMGAPIKMNVSGRQIWICCDGCKDKLLGNPDEYLAKLKTE